MSVPHRPVRPAPSSSRWPELGVCLGLVVMVVAVYLQTTAHEFVSFDDGDYIAHNPHIREGLTWKAILWAMSTGYVGAWHPTTWISHVIDYRLFGPDPAGHHWMNMQIHMANAVLLFLWLRWRTGSVWRSAPPCSSTGPGTISAAPSTTRPSRS